MRVEFYVSIDADPSQLLDWVIEYGTELAREHGGSFDPNTVTIGDDSSKGIPTTHYPFKDPTDAFISEASDDGKHWIVRALHHSAYDEGKAERPSTFVCEADYREVADILADVMNENLLEGEGVKDVE